MPKIFQLRRGAEARLPILAPGEPVFTTDTHKLVIGSDDGNETIESIEVNEYSIVPKSEINQLHQDVLNAATNAASAKTSAEEATDASASAGAAALAAEQAKLAIAAAEEKLNGIADGAEVNVNADWNATEGDAFILNKPSTFPPSTHDHDDDYEPINANIQSHISNTTNPHGVTIEQIGAAPSAKGVTNGDSHDHSGGDGAQIAYSSLSGTPMSPIVAAMIFGGGE